MQSENTLVDAMFEKPEPAKVGIADKDSDVSQVLYRKSDGEEEERPKWMDAGCPNSLKALYEFHCGKVLDKAAVEIFMSAKSLSEIRERYQVCFLVLLCAPSSLYSPLLSTKGIVYFTVSRHRRCPGRACSPFRMGIYILARLYSGHCTELPRHNNAQRVLKIWHPGRFTG